MGYRCVATSIEGFVRQLAVAYITHGYWFYVTGTVTEGKDPGGVDAKLIERYGIAISKWARCRRKKQGLANMQYLRHERFFVLLATKGRHEFFEREGASIRDVRRKAIRFAKFSIGCRKGRDRRWHASVQIAPQAYTGLKASLIDAALWNGPSAMERELAEVPYLRFGAMTRQLRHTLRLVNRRRRIAGLGPIPSGALPRQQRIVLPFESQES